MTTELATERQSKALPNAWIERLFSRLAMMYGSEKMQALWRGQELYAIKDFWAEELAVFSGDELRKALATLDAKHPSWPPTLPEFKALCRPAVSSIEPEVAFHEAVRGTYARRDGKMGEWSSRAIYWASVDVSAFDVLNSNWPQIRARWTKALEKRMSDPNLPAIPDVPLRLAEPERLRTGENPQLDAIAANVGKKGRSDPRAWVQKILDRKAAGDKTLSDIAYRAALNSKNIR